MFHLYIESDSTFSPKLIGEYNDIEEARKRAKKEQEEDDSVTYSIEESNGSFNSYGDLLTNVIERG